MQPARNKGVAIPRRIAALRYSVVIVSSVPYSFESIRTALGSSLSMMKHVHLFSLRAKTKPVERQINDGRGVQREQLAHDQPADNRDSQWAAKLGTGSRPQREGYRAKESGHRRHQDGTKTEHAGLKNCIRGRLPFLALC